MKLNLKLNHFSPASRDYLVHLGLGSAEAAEVFESDIQSLETCHQYPAMSLICSVCKQCSKRRYT